MFEAGQELNDGEQMLSNAARIAVEFVLVTVAFPEVTGSNASVAPMSAVRQVLMIVSELS